MDIERIRERVQLSAPAPLHQKLQQAIQEQITDQTLKPGEALPSERAMKEAFGISRATVRQAINTLIQEGFLQSVAGTGTFVLEQPVQSSSAGVIGLVTSSPNFNFFYPQLTAAFNHRIRARGHGLMMALHNERAELVEELTNELLQQSVIALAITPPRYGDISGLVNRLRRMNIPLVLVGRHADLNQVDVITTDNRDIGYRATRHLIDLGHTHIAYLGLLGYSTGDDRAAGYRQALQEANLPPHIYQIQEDAEQTGDTDNGFPREHLSDPARVAVHQIWGTPNAANRLPQPTAVFCFNDIVAMGAYKALRGLKRRIPQDVSLVSVDNLLTISHFEVPLSTFALPGEAIGMRSAEVLLRRLDGDSSSAETVLLQAEFVPRASTAAPPA